MKRTMLIRVLSVILVVCMLSTTVYAAPVTRSTGKFNTGGWFQDWSSWKDWMNSWVGSGSGGSAETEPVETETETEPVETETETEPVETETETVEDPADDTVMTLIEGETTVEDSTNLRATTYALTTDNPATIISEDGTTKTDTMYDVALGGYNIKYFDVTMFNYERNYINASTLALETGDLYKGLYFSNGGDLEYIVDTEEDMSAFVTGTYNIQCIRAKENNVGSWLVANISRDSTSVTSTSDQADATDWTLTVESGSYYLSCTYQGTKYYLSIGSDASGERLTTTKTAITLSAFSGDEQGVQISMNGYYLCQWGSATATQYGGYAQNNDGGNGYYFHNSANEIVAPKTSITGTSGYAPWNRWDKGADNNAGQKTWTGLVKNVLDANGNIQFNVPDAGLFTTGAVDGKTVYTNVQMPFVYSADEQRYVFNSAIYGVYFDENSTQGSTAAQSGGRLYFNTTTYTRNWTYDTTPYTYTGLAQTNAYYYGDGSLTLWMPYNDNYQINVNDCDYHFGMTAVIPFTMTTNGRLNASNDASEAISFTFSGDDDVWVFIDGQLVVDLGGIHNRLDVTIDFAENTVTYSESNNSDDATGSYNDSNFKLTQTLFNAGENSGLINMDRATFAATDDHYLTVYYLERGAGSSNCQISFNLPVKDNLTVRKSVAGQATVDSTGESVTTSDLSSLTDAQLAVLNNLDFTFTLYKNGSTVGGATYSVLDADGKAIDVRSTTSEGKFTLKNNQTAKFTTEFTTETTGDTYYVVEDVMNGFIYTSYQYSLNAAGSTTVLGADAGSYTYFKTNGAYYVTDTSADLTSKAVTAVGGAESADSLAIVCSNYMNASLPRPSALPNDDKVVIDYGLPVEIDLFSNDLYLADNTAITFPDYDTNAAGAYVASYGTFTYADGKIVYTLNKQLTGVEKIPYTLTGTAGEASASGTANVYIIPATTMYYEENFGTLVTYADGNSGKWTRVGTPETDNQEPGVVGTVGDSPYGSDAAYLKDSGDSNGSSMYVNTSSGAAQFSYTFTGTGTSFYVRTTNNSGFVRVVVYDTSDNNNATYDMYYIDTWYNDESSSVTGTLYNIPVFTYEAENYGTYKVVVTVAEEYDVQGYHSEFWLDGIRVYEPLDTTDDYYSVATSAYATDGEANMTNVTLRDKLIGEADLTEKQDEDGNIVYEVNENGEIVYEVDENGNIVLDENGKQIPVPVMVLDWNEGSNFVLFTDTNGAMTTVEEYQSIGPKQEVYLNNGQSVTFSLTKWDPNTNKVYLGIKAPTGSGTVTIGSTTLTINNAADCYYDISSYGAITTDSKGVMTITFKISAGTNSLISLTNIKVTGNAKFTIVAQEDVAMG